MDIKNFVSKHVSQKVLVIFLTCVVIVVGIGIGVAYRSANQNAQSMSTADSGTAAQSDKIMPQKNATGNIAGHVQGTDSHADTQSEVRSDGQSNKSMKKSSKGTKKSANSCLVKGVTDDDGDKVFLLPNAIGYDDAQHVTCFKSAEAASAAGYSAADMQ